MKRNLIMIYLLVFGTLIWAQEKTITGLVKTSDTEESMPGVNIFVKGTTNGVVTDLDGKYTINVNEGDVLVFSFLGYLDEEITIAAQTVVDVTLVPDVTAMEEVYVVGYGTQKKSVITGSIAKISAEELEKSTELRVEQAIQGKAAGVMVMSNSGQPGDNLTIRIRGVGTNGNADPLYIIDGLPLPKEAIDYLNPADIESIEVLKDASATAIYGTRGANGVILISTKKGKKNKPMQVSYSGYYGVQNTWRKQDLLNADEYIEIINEMQTNDGKPVKFDQETIDMYKANGWDTDWQDEMYFENAPKQSHTLSFTGGGEDNTYSSSLSYFAQDGIIAQNKSNFERFTYRLNTTRQFGILKIGSNLTLANINKKGIGGNDYYGLGINQALNMPPVVPVKYDDGTWATPTDSDFGLGLQEITNPIAMLEYDQKKERVNKLLGNVYAELEIVEGLKLRTDYGGEYTLVTKNNYTPVYYIDATHQNPDVDKVSTEMYKYVKWNWENTLAYTKVFNQHSVTGIVGITMYKDFSENVYGERQDLIFSSLDKAYLNNAVSESDIARGGYGEHTLGSYFGRVNYNYGEKYLFEGVFRADGSSRFGSENRYGFFPATSVGWVLSKEDFFPQNSVLNFAKLRFSWGQNGNENIPDFAYTSTTSNDNRYFFGSDQTLFYGIQPSRYPKPDLLWETSEQTDIGADLAFFSNMITLGMDYYSKKTEDWLVQESGASFPMLIGNVGPVINAGAVKNSGFEFELGYKQNITSDFFMHVALTGAINKSEILRIENANGYLTGGGGAKGHGDVLRLEQGEELGYFYLYETAGVFQSVEEIEAHVDANGDLLQPRAVPGDLIFLDKDTIPGLSSGDKANMGTPYPKLTTGLNVSMEWKGLDFSMFWYTAIGHQIFNVNRRWDMEWANYSSDILNRWTEENPSTTHPRVTSNDKNPNYNAMASDYFLQDADYLRLRNLTLGYTLPRNLTEKIKIKKFRLYVSGENLLTFTKYDGMNVEVGGDPLNTGIDRGNYPQPKAIIGGVQVSF